MRDRYTITERVDQGGMAEVFRGVAESIQGFKKSVAIKRILPNLTRNKKFVSMFLDEARLSLHLQHANIVHVFDIGMGADTAYFIVMEYVEGANLKAILDSHRQRHDRLKIAHTLYVMLEVCKGLAYAHDAQDPENGKPLGIVHRDISPPNILVSKMGEVKLVDFGLAKATSQLEFTDPGVVKGKFSYLSPEAANGREVDHRADIFAVGILLWEMLTGERLFFGETDYDTVELVRQARIPSIIERNPEVDPDLEAVVLRALAVDPEDRFPHAADLQEAIAQILFSRSMKVTSRDIAQLVKAVCAEGGLRKPPRRSLIDTLIQEEIAKFTSLESLTEPLEGAPAPAGASPLSPEEVGAGPGPLDPASFIDPRGWSSDLELESDAGAGATAPASQRAQRHEADPESADAVADLGSLQQMLEPDRTGTHHSAPSGGRGIAIALVIAALVALGGGLFAFKDRIFGPRSPAVQKR